MSQAPKGIKAWKFAVGDRVKVMVGRSMLAPAGTAGSKGKIGNITRVIPDPKRPKVVVEGANQWLDRRASEAAKRPIKYSRPISVSNIRHVDKKDAPRKIKHAVLRRVSAAGKATEYQSRIYHKEEIEEVIKKEEEKEAPKPVSDGYKVTSPYEVFRQTYVPPKNVRVFTTLAAAPYWPKGQTR